MKKIILITVIVGLVSFGLYQFFKDGEPDFDLFEVAKRDIFLEIWEVGRVERGERINLNFKSAGRIENIYIEANQVVEKGDPLAKLDTTDLEIQLQEARSSLELANLNLKKLLEGATPEEVDIAQSRVESAEISLENAKEGLRNSYDAAINVLNNAYPQIYNSFDFVKDFIRNYVVVHDRDAKRILDARTKIGVADETAKLYLDKAKDPSAEEKDIEESLLKIRNSLEVVFENLEVIREIINRSSNYRDRVLDSDKTLLGTLKTNINSALNSVISSQQAIISAKSGIETAKTGLREAESQLSIVKIGARQVDIELYEAQVRQARARVTLYENQIKESTLRSPIDAQVASIGKKEGEIVQAIIQDAVVSLLPVVPFEIRANIYEEDIVKMEIGMPVEINIPAFPEESFQGEIVFIDDTEKIIDAVVYYEIKVSFIDEPPTGLRTNMTADIVISLEVKENVLSVPRRAVQRVGEKTMVEVSKDGVIEEREVEVGLRGDDLIEIVSGVKEGEKVIIR